MGRETVALNLYSHGPIKKSSSVGTATSCAVSSSSSVGWASEWDIVWIPGISLLRSEFDSFN